MSLAAQDLIELLRLAQGGAGALTQHLLREIAGNLIAFGVADSRTTIGSRPVPDRLVTSPSSKHASHANVTKMSCSPHVCIAARP